MQTAQARAQEVEVWHEKSGEMQERLLNATSTIVAESAYIQATLAAVESTQMHSTAVLVRLPVLLVWE